MAASNNKLVAQVKCLECGKKFLRITDRHLQLHGMTVEEYKNKHGELSVRPLRKGQIVPFKGGPGNSALTTVLQRKICDYVKQGNRVSASAAVVGISPQTIRNWLDWGTQLDKDGNFLYDKKYYDFVVAVLQAEAESEVQAVKEVRDAGFVEWRAAMEFLARRFPDHWRPESKKIVEEADKVSSLDMEKLLGDPIATQLACDLLDRLSGKGDVVDAEVIDECGEDE
jgi:hypothetical protein